MLFNSFEFLCFFPIVILLYYMIPAKGRRIWLLLASYFFYMSWKPEYGGLILLVTVVSYSAGIFIDTIKKKAVPHWENFVNPGSFVLF